MFVPEHDAAGNQTKIRTATGEWTVAYNALNQAVSFTQGDKRVECRYDYRGRRVEKSVYEGEALVARKRFLYRNYLQIAELDATDTTEEATPILRKTYLWDPMESSATRILAMSLFDETGTYQEDLYYTHDLLKNTTALFGIQAGRRALYEYGPYGNVIKMEGNAAEQNPFRFSSEYADDEMGLVYYNYRYLNPMDGRWIGRDPMAENGGNNLYAFLKNLVTTQTDFLGRDPLGVMIKDRFSNPWLRLFTGDKKITDEMGSSHKMKETFLLYLKEYVENEIENKKDNKEFPLRFDIDFGYKTSLIIGTLHAHLDAGVESKSMVEIVESSGFWLGRPQYLYAQGKLSVCVEKDDTVTIESEKAIHTVWEDTIDTNPTDSDPAWLYILETLIFLSGWDIYAFPVEVWGDILPKDIEEKINK